MKKVLIEQHKIKLNRPGIKTVSINIPAIHVEEAESLNKMDLVINYYVIGGEELLIEMVADSDDENEDNLK